MGLVGVTALRAVDCGHQRRDGSVDGSEGCWPDRADWEWESRELESLEYRAGMGEPDV